MRALHILPAFGAVVDQTPIALYLAATVFVIKSGVHVYFQQALANQKHYDPFLCPSPLPSPLSTFVFYLLAVSNLHCLSLLPLALPPPPRRS